MLITINQEVVYIEVDEEKKEFWKQYCRWGLKFNISHTLKSLK